MCQHSCQHRIYFISAWYQSTVRKHLCFLKKFVVLWNLNSTLLCMNMFHFCILFHPITGLCQSTVWSVDNISNMLVNESVLLFSSNTFPTKNSPRKGLGNKQKFNPIDCQLISNQKCVISNVNCRREWTMIAPSWQSCIFLTLFMPSASLQWLHFCTI